MYFFNSLDRSNLGIVKTDGLENDLPLSETSTMSFYLPIAGPACVSDSLVLREPEWQRSGEQTEEVPEDMQGIRNIVRQLQQETQEAEEGRIAAWKECHKARQERIDIQIEAMKRLHEFKDQTRKLKKEIDELKAELSLFPSPLNNLSFYPIP
ncbi:hypothetical protein AbraIFM66951_010567 [Aspergillus brasiliensis]|uniref:Uncharacterized protein n=1 Tax=Aspergillus brasiliensis TaxID=319629 RepID=A0A9W5YX19_9EURO|nr:hypothetical protein AbraCBS73388_010682 [Aspergillus brasiliensis]GKZ47216.1 hypothetical protein AbraIFM66951_010567 [Aspergillus brasiliensis]